MAKRSSRKTYIIKDIVFHRLWDESLKIKTLSDYRASVTRYDNKDYSYLLSLGLDELMIYDLLTEIFRLSHMGFKVILDKARVKKAYVSHAFCIPIRTVESWYDNISPCPPYIRLMLIKHFYLMDLGKYVTLKSIKERDNFKKSTYAHSEEYEFKVLKKLAAKRQEEKRNLPATEDTINYHSSVADLLKYTSYIKNHNMD